MGTHHGKEGVVKVGSNAVAEVQSFDITESAKTVDDTAMGDTDDTHLVGTNSWQGSLSCSWDEADTLGQEALTVGASVTLNLYPEGDGAGAVELTGVATITEVAVSTEREGVVGRNFSFMGNGALTHTTV